MRGFDAAHPPAQAGVAPTAKDKTDIVFKTLLPRVFAPTAVPGWRARLHFQIAGAGDYTVAVADQAVSVSEGHEGDIDASVVTEAETFAAVLRFEAISDAGQLGEVTIVSDESGSADLSDESLELVAGGKGGVCAAEACGAAEGGGAACGAAAGGVRTGCGGAACGAAACTGDSCGGDACLTAAGGVSGCGTAACGMDACAGAVCGGDGGGTSGCAGPPAGWRPVPQTPAPARPAA